MIVAICRTDTKPYAEIRIYTKKSITTFGGRCDERWKQDATFDSEFCLKGSIRRDYHQRIAGNKPTGASPRTRRLSVIIDKLQRAAAGMVIDVLKMDSMFWGPPVVDSVIGVLYPIHNGGLFAVC